MVINRGIDELLLLQLIEAGALVDAVDDNGEAPLHAAAKKGQLGAIFLLIENNATMELDAEEGTGQTPLCSAVECGRVEAAQALLQLGAKANPRVLYLGHLQGGKLHRILSSSTSSLSAQLGCGGTALHMAACDGEAAAAAWCLEGGAATDVQDDQGATPLMLAAGADDAEEGHLVAVKLLVEHKANLELQDARGDTALHYAAKEQNAEAFEVLVRAGANLEAENGKGKTPKLKDGKCGIM